MNPHPIRVLIVDDSPVACLVLKRMIADDPDIEVVATAANGREALNLIPRLDPSIVCTDLQMPVMDGLELTRAVMDRYPRPILMVSSYVQKEDTKTVFSALKAGAVDVYPKPRDGLNPDNADAAKSLKRKIKIVAGVHVFRKPAKATVAPSASNTLPPRIPVLSPGVRILGIGASTGGPQALGVILPQLPADFPLPVLCVQHLSKGFMDGFLSWLAGMCQLTPKIAREGEPALPGKIYFPPENAHLEIGASGRLFPSPKPPMQGHRPAVDATFHSLAKHYGKAAAAVLLTGMGADGAQGMLAIAQAGGVTVAQDEKSCVVFGMPAQAIALNAATYVMSPDEIARFFIAAAAAGGPLKS